LSHDSPTIPPPPAIPSELAKTETPSPATCQDVLHELREFRAELFARFDGIDQEIKGLKVMVANGMLAQTDSFEKLRHSVAIDVITTKRRVERLERIIDVSDLPAAE
jgi:hypothetical protein